MDEFIGGEIDAVHVAYMNFISAGQQKAEVMTLLPLAGVSEISEHIGKQTAEAENQLAAGALDTRRSGAGAVAQPLRCTKK